MNGKKWADYIITKVRKDNNGRVSKVYIGEDNYGSKIQSIEKSKEEVIYMIKNGKKVITGSNEKKGAEVEIFIMGGIEYLRTDPNCLVSDNLDNLPLF